MPNLSMILNISDRASLLEHTVNSICHHSSGGYFNAKYFKYTELIVVDEGSQDNLKEILTGLSRIIPNIKIIQIDRKLSTLSINCYSPVVGLNVGILSASSNKLLIFQPETLFLKNNVSAAILNCRDGYVWLAETYSGTPAFRRSINKDYLHNINYNAHLNDKGAFKQNYAGKQDQIYPYVVATTKQNMFDIGLLDVRYAEGWASDDDDWILRHRKAGHFVEVTDGMSCYHINHNKHDANGRPVNLHGTALHCHNEALLQNAVHNITKENVADRLNYNKEISSQCIISKEVL